jgi:hypothetical protein
MNSTKNMDINMANIMLLIEGISPELETPQKI